MGINIRPPIPPRPPRPPRIRRDSWDPFSDFAKEEESVRSYVDQEMDKLDREFERMKNMNYDVSSFGILKDAFKEITRTNPRNKHERQIFAIRNVIFKIIFALIGLIILQVFVDPWLFPKEKEVLKPTTQVESGITQSKVNTGKKIGGE